MPHSHPVVCLLVFFQPVVQFPRNLRLDEKTAMKGKAGHIFQRLKNDKAYPDLCVILHSANPSPRSSTPHISPSYATPTSRPHTCSLMLPLFRTAAVVHERSLGPDSFWAPYIKLLRTNYNNIMTLTEPQMKTLLRRYARAEAALMCQVPSQYRFGPHRAAMRRIKGCVLCDMMLFVCVVCLVSCFMCWWRLTYPGMVLHRPGCENTYNLGVMMRRTFNNFYEYYKKNVETWAPADFQFSREDLL